ncbi:MAG: GntR family transcriptional regulator [Lachnospiraceae bacterium]|nr:GntR family transcriptional regulator [Lachnospiraceae bacterium]
MGWDFKNGTPIYQQIVTNMKIRIANGTYQPGERVQAVRDLALEAGVNPNTMQRALAELERDGLLRAERTSGRFVTEDEQVLKKLRSDLARTFVGELYEKLEGLGMNKDEILEAVDGWKG